MLEVYGAFVNITLMQFFSHECRFLQLNAGATLRSRLVAVAGLKGSVKVQSTTRLELLLDSCHYHKSQDGLQTQR
jgi:hypothetical protein